MILLLHVASTLFMTGLIWFVQVVHYPMFALVGRGAAANYSTRHSERTTWVVGPPMLVEAATGIWLWLHPPAGAGLLPALGLGLLAIIWLSTAALQVPCHNRLAQGFDPTVHQRLVRTNWIRTIAWTARAAIALALLNATPF